MAIPRVYFSFRSPYSWLALERLSARGLRDAFEYIPFWEPRARVAEALAAIGGGTHYRQMSRARHLYILQGVKRLAAAQSMPMVWPVDKDQCWDLPHLAWLACRRSGRQWELYDRLIERRWGRGVDICVEENIADVLSDCGLQGATLDGFYADDDLVAEGAGALKLAYDDDVFGIPYFKAGVHRFWGQDRLDAFLQHLGMADDGAPDGDDARTDTARGRR